MRFIVLEVNPRASRTVPFVAKAIGMPVAAIAARVMAGENADRLQPQAHHIRSHLGQGSGDAVRPLSRRGHDPGTGDALDRRSDGIGHNFARAFAKSQIGAGTRLPMGGAVFISVKDADKDLIVAPARELVAMGFSLVATGGTARVLARRGFPSPPSTRCWKAGPMWWMR